MELKRLLLKPFGRNTQTGSALLYATIVAAGMLTTLAFIRMKTSNLLQVTYQSRSKAIAAHANETASKMFTLLLEYRKIEICGHTLELDTLCDSTGVVCGPEQTVNLCPAGDLGKWKLRGSALTDNNEWDIQWTFVPNPSAPPGGGSFKFYTCDPRFLNDPAAMFGDTGSQPSLESCNNAGKVLETIVEAEVSATGKYIISTVSTEIDTEIQSTGATTNMQYTFRTVLPNGCTDKIKDNNIDYDGDGDATDNDVDGTSSDDDESSEFSMTNVKKVITVKNAREFAQMRSGGRYKLENDIDFGDLDGDGVENGSDPDTSATDVAALSPPSHRTPYKNIVVQGKGKKVKIRGNIDRRGEDAIALISKADCSLIDEVDPEIGDDDDSDPDDHGIKGRKCTGGLVGILSSSMVSNSRVTSKKAQSFATILAEEGLGALAGCISNGFWNSKITAIFAEAVLKVLNGQSDAQICAGGIVGKASGGAIFNATTAGQLVAVMTGLISAVRPEGISGHIGCAGDNHDPTADDNTPLIVEEAYSSMAISDCNAAARAGDFHGLCDGLVPTRPIKGCGGLVGVMESGSIRNGFVLSDEYASSPAVVWGASARPGGAANTPGLLGTTNAIDCADADNVGGIIGEARPDGRNTTIAINKAPVPKGIYSKGGDKNGKLQLVGVEFASTVIGDDSVAGIIGKTKKDPGAGAANPAITNAIEIELAEVGMKGDPTASPNQAVIDGKTNIAGFVNEDDASMGATPTDLKWGLMGGKLRKGGADCAGASDPADCKRLVSGTPAVAIVSNYDYNPPGTSVDVGIEDGISVTDMATTDYKQSTRCPEVDVASTCPGAGGNMQERVATGDRNIISTPSGVEKEAGFCQADAVASCTQANDETQETEEANTSHN